MSEQGHRDRMGRTPPGVVFQQIGGAKMALRLHATAPWEVYQSGRTELIQKIREAILQGVKTGRWSSNNAAFEDLGMHLSYGKRLMTGKPKDVKGMGDADLQLYAWKLGIDPPHPISPELHLLASIIERMREQRLFLGEKGWPNAFDERDMNVVRYLVRQVMHIDQDSAYSQLAWESWLAAQLKRARACDPVKDESWFRPRLIGLGDYLVAYPFLDALFKRDLFDRLHSLIEVQKDHPLRPKARVFMGLVGEVLELARAFQNSRGKPLDAVAQAYPATHRKTIELLLWRVGLEAAHFNGEEAVLGRLILQSPILHPFFLELFCGRDGDYGATTPIGKE